MPVVFHDEHSAVGHGHDRGDPAGTAVELGAIGGNIENAPVDGGVARVGVDVGDREGSCAALGQAAGGNTEGAAQRVVLGRVVEGRAVGSDVGGLDIYRDRADSGGAVIEEHVVRGQEDSVAVIGTQLPVVGGGQIPFSIAVTHPIGNVVRADGQRDGGGRIAKGLGLARSRACDRTKGKLGKTRSADAAIADEVVGARGPTCRSGIDRDGA